MSKIIRPKGCGMVVLPGIIKINEEENAEKWRQIQMLSERAELYAWTLLFPINSDETKSEVFAYRIYPQWTSVGGQRRIASIMSTSTKMYLIT